MSETGNVGSGRGTVAYFAGTITYCPRGLRAWRYHVSWLLLGCCECSLLVAVSLSTQESFKCCFQLLAFFSTLFVWFSLFNFCGLRSNETELWSWLQPDRDKFQKSDCNRRKIHISWTRVHCIIRHRPLMIKIPVFFHPVFPSCDLASPTTDMQPSDDYSSTFFSLTACVFIQLSGTFEVTDCRYCLFETTTHTHLYLHPHPPHALSSLVWLTHGTPGH